MSERLPQGHFEAFPREEPGHAAGGRGRGEPPSAGEVGQQARLSFVCRGWIRRFRQRLALPLPLL